jgi:hypothetical protein
MKNSLLILFIARAFSACKTNSDSTNNQERNIQLLTDSTTYHNDVLSDTSTTVSSEKIPEKVVEKTTVKTKNNSTVSSRPAPAVTPVTQPSSTVPEEKTTPATTQDSAISNTSTANTGTVDNSGASTSIPQPEKKKGWNKATQGAVIGGAAGAVGGAILSKKKGVGAVIGGIVGAAGGYIIGKNKDKKDKQSQDSAK